jgi:hypothetical protein
VTAQRIAGARVWVILARLWSANRQRWIWWNAVPSHRLEKSNFGKDSRIPLGPGKAMSHIPDALVELLYRYYGTAELPDFSGSVAVVERNPFQRLRKRLEETWGLLDATEVQYDLGWSWWLRKEDRPLNLRLSFVGPYALLLDATNTTLVEDDEIVKLVREEGFAFLSVDELACPVELWSPEYVGSLYEFLFEFDRGQPWNR